MFSFILHYIKFAVFLYTTKFQSKQVSILLHELSSFYNILRLSLSTVGWPVLSNLHYACSVIIALFRKVEDTRNWQLQAARQYSNEL